MFKYYTINWIYLKSKPHAAYLHSVGHNVTIPF